MQLNQPKEKIMHLMIYPNVKLKLLIFSVLFVVSWLSGPEATAQAKATYRSNGSDYTVTCSWEKITNTCCSETRTVRFYKAGKLAKSVGSAGKSGSTTVAAGPSNTSRYQWKWDVTGKDNTLCTFGCSANGNLSTGYNVTTARIKPVVNYTASTDKYYEIEVSWGKGTNIPNGSHGYRIYRDNVNNLVKTVNGSTRSWTDTNVGPGEAHTYYIVTYTNSWGGHQSYNRIVYGRTTGREVAADDGVGASIWIRWEDISKLGSEIDVFRDDQKIARIDATEVQYQDSDADLIPGFRYNYTLKPIRSGTVRDLNGLSDFGYRRANGRFSGEVKAPSGSPVASVQVCAIRQDNVLQGPAGEQFCDTTDASGFFDIRNIYYHQESEFKVVPKKGSHGFSPESITRFLDQSVFQYTRLTFIDTTGFTVNGKIAQLDNGTPCGIGGVELLVDGIYKGDKTDADGKFSLAVAETGNYTIRPRLADHTFSPVQQSVFVNEDLDDIDFNNETTSRLSGQVLAGCQVYLGAATVRVTSKGDGCINRMINTDANGNYEVTLPARAYQVELVDIQPDPSLGLDKQDILAYFDPEDVDMTNDDGQQSFIYRNEPSIEVQSVDIPRCGFGNRIVEQNEIYDLIIRVTEEYGDDSCPVDTGYVLITDDVSDRTNNTDTLYISRGQVVYRMVPQSVNIISPYTKTLQVTAFVDQEMTTFSEDFVVTGIRPRDQTFTTVSPSIPFNILRDPPGDASYSYLEENTTSEVAMRFFGELSGSVNAWGEVKSGTKFQAGIGLSTETEIWGSIGGSLEVGATLSGQAEQVLSITNSSYFATSDNQQITGTDGDVYVGAALNLLYALSDIVEFDSDNCQVVTDVDLIMANDGFATTFMYTENHIREVLIPDLQRLEQFYEAQGSDSSAIYTNQISVWQQTMERNADLKKDAGFVENRSFSAGAPYESSITKSSSSSLSVEFSAYIESSVAVEAGLEIGGTGVSGGVETRLRAELGKAETRTQLNSRTVGYYLSDDDPGDFFSVNIRNDKVYATPVFELVSGRSSCPFEKGTQPREGVQLQADRYVATNVNPSSSAVFQLSLGNISQSEETRGYRLAFIQSSNPNGAKVRIGGSEVQGAITYVIPFGQAATATVEIEKGPLAHDYPNLRFALLSGCNDEEIIDVISLSTYFENSCSPITLFQPANDWVVNENSNDVLTVKIRDYNTNDLDRVIVEFADVVTGVFSEAVRVEKGDLQSGQNGTTVSWNVADVTDGEYLVRLRLDCGQGYTYSEQVKGRIDRVAPQLYARPEPIDGTYSQGERISVKFDETIDCQLFSAQQMVVRNTTTGDIVNAQVGCADDRLIIAPDVDFRNQAGDVFEVMVDEVVDLYGNKMDDFVSWRFDIEDDASNSNQDTDDDGWADTQDNCPLAANRDQSDLDGDGIGDVCDEDMDGDGILNVDDNCIEFANPDQADMNNNGIGDVCEAAADGDGDGIANGSDNCPLTYNAAQADMDNDGIGDVCDDDIDGDGVINSEDNCPMMANPDQLDSNNDGQGDVCQGIVSTEELNGSLEQINIYPNPSNGAAFVEIDLSVSTPIQIRVVNMQGQLIVTETLGNLSAGKHQLEILSGQDEITPGMYQVVVQTEDNLISRPLVIIK